MLTGPPPPKINSASISLVTLTLAEELPIWVPSPRMLLS